ncbi:hypothetical protein DPMN_105425 [Dreissena polymorpha]|uniref:Uncharacterized protein n=1 Tax=Dreissena polymorpha TaxID=45954 RepID=A0A9D4HBL3_DREPO|nr:hypothetical protein DPMN_105425 [Dreissena polymorpha]
MYAQAGLELYWLHVECSPDQTTCMPRLVWCYTGGMWNVALTRQHVCPSWSGAILAACGM